MRKPTSAETALAWWRSAIETPHAIDTPMDPQCGFFRMKTSARNDQGLRVNGGWAPVEVVLECDIDDVTGELVGDERLICRVDGQVLSADQLDEQWPFFAGEPISAAAYLQLQELRSFARDKGAPINLAEDTVI